MGDYSVGNGTLCCMNSLRILDQFSVLSSGCSQGWVCSECGSFKDGTLHIWLHSPASQRKITASIFGVKTEKEAQPVTSGFFHEMLVGDAELNFTFLHLFLLVCHGSLRRELCRGVAVTATESGPCSG